MCGSVSREQARSHTRARALPLCGSMCHKEGVEHRHPLRRGEERISFEEHEELRENNHSYNSLVRYTWAVGGHGCLQSRP